MKPFKIKIKKLNLPLLPIKTYTEFEMEKYLNKFKAIQRKRDIELVKLDNENCEIRKVELPEYKPTPKPKVSWLKELKVLLP